MGVAAPPNIDVEEEDIGIPPNTVVDVVGRVFPENIDVVDGVEVVVTPNIESDEVLG